MLASRPSLTEALNSVAVADDGRHGKPGISNTRIAQLISLAGALEFVNSRGQWPSANLEIAADYIGSVAAAQASVVM